MPWFTVHVEHLFTVEADRASDAVSKVVEQAAGDEPEPDSVHMYVTDEHGEEVDVRQERAS